MSCPICEHSLSITRLSCPGCKVQFEGAFSLPRLARLEREQMNLAEKLVLAGGNLKELAEQMEVSYPTLRKRVDYLIEALLALKRADDLQTQRWLDEVEKGSLTAEEASRRIEELSYGR